MNYASSLMAAPHNLTNSFPDPLVGISQGTGPAEFEVTKPPFEDRIDLDDDVRSAATASTAEFFAKFIAELLTALVPWPFHPATNLVAFEMIPPELESPLPTTRAFPVSCPFPF